MFWSQENCHKALKNCIHGSYCSLFHEDLDPDLVSKSSELRSSEHLFHFFDFRVMLAVCPPTNKVLADDDPELLELLKGGGLKTVKDFLDNLRSLC